MAQGPNELASKFMEMLAQQNKKWESRQLRYWDSGFLSEESLRKVIDAAFQVSLMPEEGRYPRFSILLPLKEGAGSRVVELVPVDLIAKNLHRLGPAIPPRPFALEVRELNDEVKCVGITRFETPSKRIAQPQDLNDAAFGIVLAIEGPGWLNLDGFLWQLHLKQCKVSEPFLLRNSQFFEKWVRRTADQIADYGDVNRDEEETPVPLPDYPIAYAWTSLLNTISHEGHGGALVVMPEESLADAADNSLLKPRYTIKPLNLGGAALDHWLASERDGSEVDQIEGQRFADMISSISQLASTDGCVVFDEYLQLRSFGSFIRDSGKDIEAADHVLELRDDGSVSGEKSIEDLGTRHKSAALLCAQAIGTHAFVVSQDGPIHVFFSGEHHDAEGGRQGKKSVFLVGPFDPAIR